MTKKGVFFVKIDAKITNIGQKNGKKHKKIKMLKIREL